jgi:hypothetical protein
MMHPFFVCSCAFLAFSCSVSSLKAAKASVIWPHSSELRLGSFLALAPPGKRKKEERLDPQWPVIARHRNQTVSSVYITVNNCNIFNFFIVISHHVKSMQLQMCQMCSDNTLECPRTLGNLPTELQKFICNSLFQKNRTKHGETLVQDLCGHSLIGFHHLGQWTIAKSIKEYLTGEMQRQENDL